MTFLCDMGDKLMVFMTQTKTRASCQTQQSMPTTKFTFFSCCDGCSCFYICSKHPLLSNMVHHLWSFITAWLLSSFAKSGPVLTQSRSNQYETCLLSRPTSHVSQHTSLAHDKEFSFSSGKGVKTFLPQTGKSMMIFISCMTGSEGGHQLLKSDVNHPNLVFLWQSAFSGDRCGRSLVKYFTPFPGNENDKMGKIF